MRNRFFNVVVILLLIGSLILAFTIRKAESTEPPETEWNMTYGGANDDVAWCVIQTDDGGYAILGFTYSFGGGQADVLLIKTDATGTMQWNRTYGDSDWERGYCLIQTDDGGYAIAGEKAPSPPPSNRDFWLIKTYANGTMQWNRTYGGTKEEEAYSVIQTSDGGYAIAGRTLSFGVVGKENMWLVKTDGNGNMEWNKAFGGTGIEIAYSVVQTSDGGYAIGGETGAHGNVRDVWLVKTDATGTLQWSEMYGVGSVDFSNSLVQTVDGGFALAGATETPAGGFADVYLVKTFANGTMQWDRTYGGGRGDWAWSMVQTTDGGYALAGSTESYGAGGRDFWLIKADSVGNAQWNITYGGPGNDWAYSVIQVDGGEYAVAGWTESFGAGGQDFWLIKTGTQTIDTTLDVDPDSLNLRNRGDYVTAYIELPEAYDVTTIDPSTILLKDTVHINPDAPQTIGDHDHDGIPDLMVKFDRSEVTAYILSVLGAPNEFTWVTLTITGALDDGTIFEGNDVIKAIYPRSRAGKRLFIK